MTYDVNESNGNESGKVLWELVPYTNGRGLDIGCGVFKAFPHFIGIDNYADTRLFGVHMQPDVVCHAEDLGIFASGSLDFVFSSHVLEHIEDTEKTLTEWWRVVKTGGYLILYLPHKDFYPNIGEKDANPDHKHDFLPQDIVDYMKAIGSWDLLRNEDRNGTNEYSFFQVYKKIVDPGEGELGHLYSCNKPKPGKTAAVVRYGGIGDMIQAASIFPLLKKQGYHVTLYTASLGEEICRTDPNIDHIIVQGKDQVPNKALSYFWENEKKKYDKWVQLSESVEVAWLAAKDHVQHEWPHNVRKKYLNANYLEFIHDLADVPYEFNGKFYPTEEERQWALEEHSKIGPALCWSLSGSAPHKRWPWMDEVIARLMLTTDVSVVLMGDALCQILEAGWENEPRVLKRSGKWTIRQSLAFAERAIMVVGPETGLLNAVGALDVAKVVMLSHSSANNLTKHWKNTTTLEPVNNTPCFPCHMHHQNWDHCHEVKETRTALCQHNIGVEQAWKAIRNKLPMRKAA